VGIEVLPDSLADQLGDCRILVERSDGKAPMQIRRECYRGYHHAFAGLCSSL
jgi:hypothetical protein